MSAGGACQPIASAGRVALSSVLLCRFSSVCRGSEMSALGGCGCAGIAAVLGLSGALELWHLAAVALVGFVGSVAAARLAVRRERHR